MDLYAFVLGGLSIALIGIIAAAKYLYEGMRQLEERITELEE